MVDTFINQGQVDRGAVYDTPRMNTDVVYDVNSNTQGLDQLVGALDGFIAQASKTLDKETVRKAQQAGSMAGLQKDYKPLEGTSLAAETYNRAGTEIFINKKIADVSTTINKVSMDTSIMNDPVATQHRLEDMKADLSKDVPLEVLPQFDIAYNDRMQRVIQQAQGRQHQLQISANQARFMEAEVALTAEATNAARGGDDGAVAQTREEYFSSINKQVGLSLSPAEATRKKIVFDKQIQKDAVVGEFLRTPADKRAAFATKFIEDNPLADIMTAKEIDGLKRDMVTAWQVDDNLIEGAELELKETQTEAAKQARGTFLLEPTPENYAAYIKMPTVEPEDAAKAKEYLAKGLREPDPIVDHKITQLIRNGWYETAREELNKPENFNALPATRVAEHMTMIDEMKGGAGFEKTEPYQEVQRRIQKEYAATSIYGQTNSATGEAIQQQIYDELRVKYPRYLQGEIPYEDVDPVRMYNLKKANYRKTEAGATGGIGEEVMTSTQGSVIIPQKYIDDPEQFVKDSKNGLGPQLSTPEVESFMAEKIIAKEKEKATAQ